MSRKRYLLGEVAERTLDYPYKIWGYGEGPALHAVLHVAVTLRRPDLVDAVTDLVAPSLNAPPHEEVDHLIPVEVLLELHRLRPTVDVSDALARYVKAVAHAPKPVPGRPAVHRPH